jgi:DNA-directed RNA polymerase specialized sigma24 family protein
VTSLRGQAAPLPSIAKLAAMHLTNAAAAHRDGHATKAHEHYALAHPLLHRIATQAARNHLANQEAVEDAANESLLRCWQLVTQHRTFNEHFVVHIAYSRAKNEARNAGRHQRRVNHSRIENEPDFTDAVVDRAADEQEANDLHSRYDQHSPFLHAISREHDISTAARSINRSRAYATRTLREIREGEPDE